MMRGLLVADVPGWAFDQNERDMAEYVTEIEWGHHYMSDGSMPPPGRWDFMFLPYHPWISWYFYSRIYGSLRCRWFNPGRPGAITSSDVAMVKRCARFHVVTQANYDELRAAGCDNVDYLTNPVSMRRFTDDAPPAVHGDVACCWTGNANHKSSTATDIKGLHSVIMPAVSDARVVLRLAEYNTCRLAPAQMPEFYATANVCLCASLYEGASNSVMEAMAAGLAVVATDVGNHREMQASQIEHYGDSGIIITDRSAEAFSRAIRRLKAHPERVREMGEINRREIAERWSWDAWRDRYATFFGCANA